MPSAWPFWEGSEPTGQPDLTSQSPARDAQKDGPKFATTPRTLSVMPGSGCRPLRPFLSAHPAARLSDGRTGGASADLAFVSLQSADNVPYVKSESNTGWPRPPPGPAHP